VALNPVQVPIGLGFGCHAILEYLLIIHLRKKSAAWRKVADTFLQGVGKRNDVIEVDGIRPGWRGDLK
jgi:hypothetical protein